MRVHETFLKTMVLPCAGRSTRFEGASVKFLAESRGRPLLHRVMAPWVSVCNEWIVVVPPEHSNLRKTVSELGVRADFVIQPEQTGIADAVIAGAPGNRRNFTVLLGDCIVEGSFEGTLQPEEAGIGIFTEATPNDIQSNYGVVIKHGFVTEAIEKPEEPEGYSCGMGIYFFTPELLEFFKAEARDTGHGLQMTGLLDKWVSSGGMLRAVDFRGIYINVNTAEDLRKASY